MKDLRRNLGRLDHRRLQPYLASSRDVEKRLSDKEDILERGRPGFDEEGVRLQPQGKNGMQEPIELLTDLIALAFQTDMTRVITHCLGGEGGPSYVEYKEWARKAGGQIRGAHDYLAILQQLCCPVGAFEESAEPISELLIRA